MLVGNTAVALGVAVDSVLWEKMLGEKGPGQTNIILLLGLYKGHISK